MTSEIMSAASTNTPSTNTAARLLEHLAGKFGGKATVTAVFGEPITHDNVTVIPVAKVGFGFGGGAGHGGDADGNGEGGGGGGGAGARPLGFIEITNGKATYHPIHNHWLDLALPLTALLLATIARLRRRR